MEAVVDVKYRPALYRHGGGGAVEPTKKLGAAAAACGGAGEIVPAAGAGVYLECLRNHAASAGGHVVDGCCEFMPAATAASLRCAACGYHRSFHRRLAAPPPPPPPLALLPPPSTVAKAAPPHLLTRGEEESRRRVAGNGRWDDDETDEDSDYYDDGGHRPMSPLPAPAMSPPTSFYLSPAPPPHTPASSFSAPAAAPQGTTVPVPGAPLAAARKRFRSRFSPEQKRAMRELSERVGWRLRRRDDAVVDDTCRDIGVTRAVFKVWMHNNKHNFVPDAARRRNRSASSTTSASPVVPAPAAAVAASGVQLQPSSHAAAAASVPPPTPVVVHAGFNISGSHAGFNINSSDAEYYVVQPATAS
ncbi:hypothetical protein QOZ80_8AG0632080 [Eleusine coracana subsp. coracana]|nr:hypothetical protein QOZ80_8AG0632080 [Eleusine coracana subsp. coracana]